MEEEFETSHEEFEVVHEVHSLPQSSGRVMDGGDCGFCCLAGILSLPTILSAYEFLESIITEDWKCRDSMSIYRCKYFLLALGVEFKDFQPSFKYYRKGLPPLPWDNHNWPAAICALLKEGNVFLTSVRFNRSAPPPPRSGMESDHNVIINGYRQFWKDHPTVKNAKSLTKEIRVSCSVRGTYWIGWEELLYWHGGYPTIPMNYEECRKKDRKCYEAKLR